jgi:hypothetical protein
MRGKGCVLALAFLLCGAAHANENEAKAKQHYEAGERFYTHSDYGDALIEFEDAYKLSKKPALLFDIGRCQEALGHLSEAVDAFEHYLVEEPFQQDRPNIEEHIANLRVRMEPSAPNKPTAVVEPPLAPQVVKWSPPNAPPPRRRIWTWAVGGVGAGLLVAGMGTGIGGYVVDQNLHAQCPGGICNLQIVPDARSQADMSRSLGLASEVLLPLGAVTVGVSVVLFFVEPRRH